MKSNKKPFYKQWWAVTIAFIFVFFVGYIFGSAASSSDDSNDEASVASSSKSSSKSTTDDKSSGKNNAKKTLTVSYKNYEISSEKTFKPNYTNNSWAGGSVSVDSILCTRQPRPTIMIVPTMANSLFKVSCRFIT
ncbi:hypothetical protein ACIA39_08590 [Lactobacillus delbrueckii subsp. bulgaricus]|uniref:hypothetical protein n=1 Tax=Lactobacillus delbrueckii TaxID=1584 RepID=UPI0037CC9426